MSICLVLGSSSAHALPIGFGYNQGDREFMELQTNNFRVYHDKVALEDAKLAMKSLEAAKPHLENWFGIARKSPLIVNMSAMSENPSFANFVTDSIELQTLGQGSRDLAWHEYTHSMMYRHLDNWFGPAGAIIHLPWMEAWFLEGLAEAFSVSIGSDEQAGVERYQALTDKFPSWDRIHSLYAGGDFSYRGYATSGAFVSWILRKYDPQKLPAMLQLFQSDSAPWYWPWAILPFNKFLPMDNSLRFLTQKSGKELYDEYKTEAKAYWTTKSKAPMLSSQYAQTAATKRSWEWISIDGNISKSILPSNSASVQVARHSSRTNPPENLSNNENTAWIEKFYPKANKPQFRIAYAANTPKDTRDFANYKIKYLPRNTQWIYGPWLTSTQIWWHEVHTSTAKICNAPLNQITPKAVKCVFEARMPTKLRLLGQSNQSLWLSQDTETTLGENREIVEINLESGNITTASSPLQGKVHSIARSKDAAWHLTSNRAARHLVKIDANGSCTGMIEISDHPVRILDSKTELPHVVLYTVDGYIAKELPALEFPVVPCRQMSQHTSPVLAAAQEFARSQRLLSLGDALTISSIWSQDTNTTTSQINTQVSAPPREASSSMANAASDIDSYSSAPAKWRGRPVFAFPWIAADDALGPQIGLISVPLMDEMQNETLRATVLIGTVSKFPYQELSLISNRYKPTWSVSAFRAQTYNGRYRAANTGTIQSSYLEEAGGNISGSYTQEWNQFAVSYSWNVKNSNLKPYIGVARGYGRLVELSGALSTSFRTRDDFYSRISLRGSKTPSALNSRFNYDVVALSTTLGQEIHHGKIEIGLDGSRTRGPKRRDLQEMYTPLKTLVPGTGGDFNQTSYALSEDMGLFTPSFGDNQARARLLVSHPIIEDIDKFLGLIYIDKLNLNGFLNYGGAWRGSKAPTKSKLIAAQGYSADLNMDNKGVNFRTGLGVGQIIGKTWQGYWTFGFDALF